MKKSICVLTASAVMGVSFFGFAESAQQTLLEKQLGNLAKSNRSCTDFSGNWSGKCSISVTSEDGKESTSEIDQSLKIKQSACDYLVLNDRMVPLGGSLATNINTNGYSVSSTEKNTWNSSNDKVITDGYAEITVYEVNSQTVPSTRVTWLEGKELATDESATALTRRAENPEVVVSSRIRVTCRYSLAD
jgi:hypothetical protein